MSWREIIIDGMNANGYTGLRCIEYECSCTHETGIAPCVGTMANISTNSWSNIVDDCEPVRDDEEKEAEG